MTVGNEDAVYRWRAWLVGRAGIAGLRATHELRRGEEQWSREAR